MHPLYKRWISQCFDSVVDLDGHEDEIDQALIQHTKIQRTVSAMLDGSLSLKDMLESIEDCVPKMDEYIEEVADNLEEVQLIL